ncbi:MAG: hypothetical protein IPL16_05280 [Ignavibacteria bacterium]|nr:hypothetical protein [Ignavibacteria bacterium]
MNGKSTKSTDGTRDVVTVKYNSAGHFMEKNYNGSGNLDDPVQMEIDNNSVLLYFPFVQVFLFVHFATLIIFCSNLILPAELNLKQGMTAPAPVMMQEFLLRLIIPEILL